MATGWLCHELYFWHDTRAGAGFIPAGHGTVEPDTHAENPGTKRRFRNLLEVSGVLAQLVPVAPRPATEEEVLRFHTREYVDRIKALSADNGGDAGELTPFGPGGYEIALLAAGGVMSAIDAVLDGTVDNIYALVRPPGHHAEADLGRGFCIFANAALAVMHARESRGLARVAVVDWDVHHGNGTQKAFYADPSVLTISVHQDNYYPPGSGYVHENGEGAGEGYAINVPLPPGSGVGAYVATFERVVAPALRAFRPELIVVASGLDASAMDPLAHMMVHSGGYRQLTRILLDVAAEVCGGRLVVEHEGGYSSAYVPYCGLAVVEELAGVRGTIEDPFLPIFEGVGGQALQPHQDTAIAAAEASLTRLVGS
ncbi:MAG: class II histone deacetylase [Thermoleophilia bacterium]|nr:class II histone deacetylase [Thermoleophilia bacterium]